MKKFKFGAASVLIWCSFCTNWY
ncbi:hypothetical protein [Streptococcus agalactiae]|nr:hypothetical protein [Streptococcus agalactiae]